jgi:hypothetical protein
VNPNNTVHYLPQPFPATLNENWRKYIIQANTTNDIRLNFTTAQKLLIPRVDMDTYILPSYPKPYTTLYGKAYQEATDICFGRIVSPDFPIWLEKIKVCVHAKATYGCVKINVWDFGTSITATPRNLVEINRGQASNINIPLTVYAGDNLISNVLDSTDLYMVKTTQVAYISPFGETIASNSLVRFGIQYAEGDAYGVKVFLIGWVLECDKV